jgi:hypothetical protein
MAVHCEWRSPGSDRITATCAMLLHFIRPFDVFLDFIAIKRFNVFGVRARHTNCSLPINLTILPAPVETVFNFQYHKNQEVS